MGVGGGGFIGSWRGGEGRCLDGLFDCILFAPLDGRHIRSFEVTRFALLKSFVSLFGVLLVVQWRLRSVRRYARPIEPLLLEAFLGRLCNSLVCPEPYTISNSCEQDLSRLRSTELMALAAFECEFFGRGFRDHTFLLSPHHYATLCAFPSDSARPIVGIRERTTSHASIQ